MINGGVEAGPNAVLALAREGYSWGSINPRELAATLSNPGLWRFIARHSQMTIAEVTRSVRISMFAKALQKLVPEITKSDLSAGFSGVRAQAMTSEGHLVQDFSIIERSDAVHVLNAPSPGATASFAIGRYISDKVERQIRGYSKVTAKN
jgi:L-2-hydroxyglutarate oxidase